MNNISQKIAIVVPILLALFSSPWEVKAMENQSFASDALFVFDEPNLAKPIRFRVSAALKASASGQFSEKNLLASLPRMQGKIWIVDLRQESHGFLNGKPVSWYAPRNASNQGLSVDEILNKEQSLLVQLSNEKEVIVHTILKKVKGKIADSREDKVAVKSVKSENELVTLRGLHYLRIPVLDHHRPDDENIEAFIHFVEKLPQDAWVHFHCRGGKGRSTTFMALYDMLHNAKQDSLHEIITRQTLLGGSDLFKQPGTDSLWKSKAALARQDFLTTFYQYAKIPYPRISWKDFLSQNIASQ